MSETSRYVINTGNNSCLNQSLQIDAFWKGIDVQEINYEGPVSRVAVPMLCQFLVSEYTSFSTETNEILFGRYVVNDFLDHTNCCYDAVVISWVSISGAIKYDYVSWNANFSPSTMKYRLYLWHFFVAHFLRNPQEIEEFAGAPAPVGGDNFITRQTAGPPAEAEILSRAARPRDPNRRRRPSPRITQRIIAYRHFNRGRGIY